MRRSTPIAGLALAILLALPGCTHGGSAAAPQPSSGPDPTAIVRAFYKLALQDFQPREAFARYAAPGFVEHSQDSAGGTTESTIVFLDGLIAKAPQGRWEIVRTVAEGELVFVHVRYLPAPGGPEIAIAELFRVHDGKLLEHWDVISGPPDPVVNPTSRF